MMHYNTRVNKIIEEQYMSYKVLNTISTKNLSGKEIVKYKSSLLVVVVDKTFTKNELISNMDESTKGSFKRSIRHFLNSKASSVNLQNVNGLQAKDVLLVKSPNQEDTFVWLDCFKAIPKMANSLEKRDLSVIFAASLPKGKDLNWVLEITARQIESNAYIFGSSKNKTVKKPSLKSASVIVNSLSPKDFTLARKAVKRGFAVGEAMNAAKFLGDLPANHCTPRIIERKVKGLKKLFPKLKIKTFGEKDLASLKMGSFLSVGRGSDEPSRMMTIEYTGGKSSEKPIVLVGKGITFDTGGISLKPSPAMDEMKWDMCGAASVFGTMIALARLNAKVNVVGVMACAENMPSAHATKPGDVVTSMSGQTIEILNTDAEGRLVLCDALTYVKRFKPAHVIDIATLTGAVVVALGNFASGLMANDQKLADKLLDCGEITGDRAWQLPLWNEYKACTKTNFADLANIGGAGAGTVTAACFLSKFTDDYSWAHIDIAGTAWMKGAEKGGTGRPVPLLCQHILGAVK